MDFRRRDLLKYGAAALAGLATARPLGALAQTAAPVAGGHASVAMSLATETVDPHFSRSRAARNVLMHMCETLVTIDERGSPSLQLAEKLEVSEDFRTYTFSLRKGVPFHNGKEMTSTDVKASLERYAQISPEKVRLANVDSITTPDPYVAVVELKSSTPSWIELIKSPASPMTIIPAEECTKEANAAQPISTGPFTFVDWDGVTQLNGRKFADYAANTNYSGRDGYSGKRTAWLDEITFRVVPEPSSRVAGLQSGEFHIIDEVPVQAANRLASDSAFRVLDYAQGGIDVIPVNLSRAPTDKLLVRQAIQRALDVDEIMTIASNGAYNLNPSFVYPANEYYPENAGSFVYNANDRDGARALLAEAGYNNEELIILSSADNPPLQSIGVVVAEQLKSIGLNVKLEMLDTPGANARRADPTAHNLFCTAFSIQPLLGPFQYQRLVSGADNWSFYKDDKVMEAAWVKLLAATDSAGRKAAWQEVETRLNGDVHIIKLGDVGAKLVTTNAVENFQVYDAIRLWDLWLTR